MTHLRENVYAALVALALVVGACSDGDSGNASGGDVGDDGVADALVDDASADVAGGADGEDLACSAALPELDSLRVTIEGSSVRDALGREVLLRGINAGGRAKLPPFFAFPFAESGDPLQEDAPPFDEAVATYADRLVDWGMTTVRLPFTWEAVEPERGAYDALFIERYAALAEAFGIRGIRVIVDFHQDVFARPFCGDGFPLWAILDPLSDKERDCHSWFLGYLQDDEVQAAYDHFWANDDDLQGSFADMWRVVTEALWSVEGVIGFEIINEPGWGTAEPGEWAKDVLTPFYSAMVPVLREAAPGAPLFFDSTGTDAVAVETALELPEGDGLVFAPHFYDPAVIIAGQWNGDTASIEGMGAWRTQGDEWDVPVLVGEFGIRALAEGAGAYVRKNYDVLDAHLLHGTQWEYSSTIDDWNDEGMSVFHFEEGERDTVIEGIRAYPLATAGTTESFVFDRASLEGTWIFAAAAGGLSELVVPTRLYGEAVTVSVDGGESCWEHHPGAQRVAIRSVDDAVLTVRFGPGE